MINYLKNFLPYLFGNKKGNSYELPNNLTWENLSFEERLMFKALGGKLNQYVASLPLSSLGQSESYQLLSYHHLLENEFARKIEKEYSSEFELYSNSIKNSVLAAHELQELFDYSTKGELTLFAVLNSNRQRPGKIFLRLKDGSFLRRQSGEVWSVSVLGHSGRGLAFCYRNGQTPCGVFSIDSVMPEANNQKEFGKNRRLILNFIESSENEQKQKSLFPISHHKLTYWQQALVARNLGRDHLRIHGTGTLNNKFYLPYFPMVPSSGCLTLKERSFPPFLCYNDQRLLLDKMMESLGFEANYHNETNIRGLLYVVEFDGTYQELRF